MPFNARRVTGVPLEVGVDFGYSIASFEPGGFAMPTGAFDYRDAAERVAIERAIAFVTQSRDLALRAPHGQVLDRCEGHVLGAGRDLLRTTLQHAVQTSTDRAEEKKGRIASARAGANDASSGVAGGT